jgi:predicted DNA-binding protein
MNTSTLPSKIRSFRLTERTTRRLREEAEGRGITLSAYVQWVLANHCEMMDTWLDGDGPEPDRPPARYV